MASVYERQIARRGTNRESSRVFIAEGYATEALAIAAVHASSKCPSTIGDQERVTDETQAEEFSYQVWDVVVTWRLFEPSSGLNYTFNIGGASIFREYAISTTSYANAGDTAPDFKDAINFDGEDIEGVQLPQESGFTFVIPARKPIADVDIAYVTAVADLYLTVNDASFEGFPAGEVLFLGVSGSRVGEDEWQLYYRFARSDNLTGKSVDTITSIDKEGWEYLWVYYEPVEDATAFVLAAQPKAVYVQQVFEDGDFTDLEL